MAVEEQAVNVPRLARRAPAGCRPPDCHAPSLDGGDDLGYSARVATWSRFGGWMMWGRARKAKFIATALAFCALDCGTASSKENLDRSDREAILLFEHIISSDKDYYKTCTISNKWLDYSVFAQTVRTYIKYPVRGDLSPPQHMTEPKDIIGKGAGAGTLICSEAERSAHTDAALSAPNRSGDETFRGQKILASTSTAQREFSYPIFDTNYHTAFVVRNNSRGNWVKTEDKKFRRFGDGEIAVFIYRKKHGKWRFKDYDVYATYH